jgi:hypothetical protein
VVLAALAVLPSSASAKPTWLCKPGLADNPCEPGFDTTVLSPSGQVRGTEGFGGSPPEVDCFYVYPTTSNQPTPQANLDIDPELRSIALYQAARYSSECRVFAPVYRQITIQGLLNRTTVTQQMRESAYQDVVDAWRYYLKKHNKGRGVVLIGHSQGTGVLRRLVAKKIDPKRSARKRLISALLLGGTVLVKTGSDRGGDFQNIPACRSSTQYGCVVAFSTYEGRVPDTSLFGRTEQADREVLCTNPTKLAGGSGRASPIIPTEPFAKGTVIGALTTQIGFVVPEGIDTPWISVPKAYKARCSSAGGANVLQIKPRAGAPVLKALPEPGWGLHLADANIALGNLVKLVRSQAEHYLDERG